ncbi:MULTISPECIES: PKD domain-containing protein [unclassified Carboxylicivirga]|uniref:PKD domain-containing protein n=1 Tax=Carboxylicivirga TaxID=1628153 RepID=UPI003D33AF2D
MAVLLCILVLLGVGGQNTFAQVEACAGGVLQLGDTFDEMVPPPVNGHRDKGYWTASPSLTFSNSNDPNAIVSGFVRGVTYSIIWHHQGGKDYELTVVVSKDANVDNWKLLNEDDNTDDVVLCEKEKYDFYVPWDGDLWTETVEFWVTHDADGSSEAWGDAGNWFGKASTIKPSEYDDQDLIWALVNDHDGCQIKTNEIRISSVAATEVRVQGGISVCQTSVVDLNLVLEVIPFDPVNYEYQWYKDGIELSGEEGGTYPITEEGSYHVVVEGCDREIVSNVVTVTEDLLPEAVIDGNHICENPEGQNATLTSSVSGGDIGTYTMEWVRNGVSDATMGNAGTATTNAVGSYQLKLVSATDDQCYRLSNEFIVEAVSPVVNVFDAIQPGLCLTEYTPEISRQFSGGNGAPFVYTLRELGQGDRDLTANNDLLQTTSLGGTRTASTTIQLVNVTDANGCMASGLPLEAVFNFTPSLAPVVKTISGIDVCAPASTTVTCPLAEKDVVYYLAKDDVEVPASRQTGDGATDLSWTVSDPGTYTVYAVDPCDGALVLMADQVMVSTIPLEQTMTQLTGDGCSNVTHVFGLDDSELGVSYTLYRDGNAGQEIAGTSDPINFDGVSDVGTYTIYAKRGACERLMDGSFAVKAAPDVVGITMVGSDGCSNELKNIGISANQTGVTYELILDGDTSAPVKTIVGDGTAGDKNFFATPTQLAAGVYTVLATAPNACEALVTGVITISPEPTDLPFVGGVVCGSGDISIPNAQAGVTYTLYFNNGTGEIQHPSYTPVTPISDGTTVSFNGLNAPGTYRVYAESGICDRFLSRTLIVERTPQTQTVTVPDAEYCADEPGVEIDLANTENGVEYVLIDDTGADVAAITGDGTARSFINVKEGIYSVEARSSGGACVVVLADNITINENALPTPEIDNLPNDFCEDQEAITLFGRPRNDGGSWAGQGITDNNDGTASFDPGAVSMSGASYNITYTYVDGNGCSNTIIEQATVHANAIDGTTLQILLPDGSVPDLDYCEDSPVITLKAVYKGTDIITNEAVFSGNGVTDGGDGTATFSPAAAGLGSHTIRLDYVDAPTNCEGFTTLTVQVGTALSLVNPFPTSFCSSDNAKYRLAGLVEGAVPPAGTTTFEIWDDADKAISPAYPNDDFDFVPADFFLANGAGDYQLVFNYNVGSCVNRLIMDFSIYESLDPSILIDNGSGQTNFCYEHGAVSLKPVSTIPSGAIVSFKGNGVAHIDTAEAVFSTNSDNIVYAPASNPITLTIDNHGCVTDRTRNITVTKVETIIVDLLTDYCTNDVPQTIKADKGIAEVKATFTAEKNGNLVKDFLKDNGDNTATIDPSVGEGNYVVTMTYKQLSDGCTAVVQQNVRVHLAQPVTFTGVVDGQKICRASAPIDLTGTMPDIDGDGTPDGVGNFLEITGLTNTGSDTNGNAINADDGKAVLNPSAMLPGTYTIRYEYLSDPGSCFTYYEKEIVIVDSPSDIFNITVNEVVGGDASYCIDDDPKDKGVIIGLDGSNTDVTYELLLGGAPLDPVVEVQGDGGAIEFGRQSVEGTYTVRAKVGACDAIMTGSVTVEQYELILQATNITHNVCKDDKEGALTLKASGGSGNYEYRNESAATSTWTATPSFTGLAAGTYEFSVRDLAPSACEKLDAITVEIKEPATALTVVEDEAQRINVGCVPCSAGGTCEGSATIVVSGGTPFTGDELGTYPTAYKITWPDRQNGLTANGLAAGTYGVTVEDANGCVETINIIIENNDPLNIIEYDVAANHIDNNCYDGAAGEFMVKATGGSGEYMFSLDGDNYVNSNQPDQTLHLFTGLAAGDYTIYVQDKNYTRCTFDNATQVTITEPAAPLSLTETANVQVSCSGGADGSFTVQAAGGNGTYEFSLVNPAVDNSQWQAATNAPNELVVSGLSVGSYSVWVRDAKPEAQTCTPATIVVTVTEAVALSFNAPVVVNPSCYNNTDGKVVLSGAGGSGNYVYSINDGTGASPWQASNTFKGLRAGVTYTFSIAEAAQQNTCNKLDILSVTLTEPSDFTTSEVVTEHKDVSCFGGNDGSFTVATTGGEGIIEYYLTDGTNEIRGWDPNPVFENLSVGTYQVSVRDRGTTSADFCEKTNVLSVVIQQPTAGLSITSEVVTPATCHGSATGAIAITVDGGTPDYSYQWHNIDTNTPVSPANGGETANAINLVAGNYRVTITDANECDITSPIYTITENTAINVSLDAYTDVTCYDAADGTITISASGGSGAYRYSIDGGAWEGGPATSYTFTGVDAGMHVIMVEDMNVAGCIGVNTVQQNITQPSQLSLSATVTPVSCNGLADGSITISPSGRAAITDYEFYCNEFGTWQTSPTFSGLVAGTYHFKVRDKITQTCESVLTGPYVVSEPDEFTTTVTIQDVTCKGGTDGQLTFATLPANGVYEYSINGGAWQTTPVEGLPAGVYQIQVRDVNTTCVKNLPDAVISEPGNALVIDNVITTDVDCHGSATGAVEVSVSGGSGVYTYQWRNMSTGIDVLPANQGDRAKAIDLPAGDYRVTITDDSGCSLPSPVYTITQPNELTATYTVSHISVVGLTDGQIVVANPPTGGTAPYTITWNDGNTLWTRDNLTDDTYRFTVTDAKGCEFTQDVEVFANQALDLSVVSNSINCFRAKTGILDLTISGGTSDYTINWSGTLYDNTVVSGTQSTAANNLEIKDLFAGVYSVTVTDAKGVSLTKTKVEIKQPAELTISKDAQSDISCYGQANGQISVTLSGHDAAAMPNYNMSWSGPGGYADAGAVKDVSNQNNLSLAGDYTVTVNYNSTCAVSETFTINAPTEIVATYTETHISAAGASDGKIVVDVPSGGVGPYTITWADGAAFDGQWTRSGLAPKDYSFTIKDATGCTNNYTATILGVKALDFTATPTPINCFGDAEGIIALLIKGGVAPFDVQWDAVLYDGSTASDSHTNITSNYELKNLQAGKYQVTITDANGATLSKPVEVKQPNELLINILQVKDISCAGEADGHIQVELAGHDAGDMNNYTLTWIGPGGFSASGTPADANPITNQEDLALPGTYTITANYNNSCYVSDSYVIAEPTPIEVTHTVKQISVVGGTDGRIVVNKPSGGTPGYTITWADDAAFDNVWTRDNLAKGTYTYTVTDQSNCELTQVIEINELSALNFSATANAINCYGANTGRIALLISGGEAPYQISWEGVQFDNQVVSDVATTPDVNFEISDLYAGDYTVRVRDNKGIEVSQVLTVVQPNELIINLSPSNISCFGEADGAVLATVTHGANNVDNYSIAWSGPAGYSRSGIVKTHAQITDLARQGVYQATVNYNGSCSHSESVYVNEPEDIEITLESVTEVSCHGGSDGALVVAASGGADFSYQWYKWNAGSGAFEALSETGTSISDKSAGRYKVEAILASTGCVGELECKIPQPDALAVKVTPVNITGCNGDDSGELQITITGGTQPYRYNYGTGDIALPVGTSSAEITKLTAGFYNVVVTDAKGCVTAVNNTLINQPNALQINVIKESISCVEGGAGWPDGELVVEISGGRILTMDHNYLITLEAANHSDVVRRIVNPNGATHTETFDNLSADSYTLKVYDENSTDPAYCVQSYDFVLEPISVSVNVGNASCEGVSDGSITDITISGASKDYTYNWSSPDGGLGLDNSTLNQDGLSVGTYELTIADPNRNACSVTETYVVGYDKVLVIEGTTYDVECYGDASGAITLDVAGVGANPVYYWTGPGITAANENNKDQAGLVAGDYTVLVSDASTGMACTASRTFTVKEPAAPLSFNVNYEITACDPYIRTLVLSNIKGGSGNPDPAFGDFTYHVAGPGNAIQDVTDYRRFKVTKGGLYTVKIVDKNNCETSHTITIPEEIAINPVITDVKCNGGQTGGISVNLTGGSSKFAYSWTKTDDGAFTASTPTISNLFAGEYVLEVTDLDENEGGTNCIRTYTFQVKEPLPIMISDDDKGHVTCNGDADGYINLDIQGGVAPYTYSWSPVSGGIVQGQKNQSGLVGGTYTITVVGANGCTAQKDIIINEDAPLDGVIKLTDTNCDGSNGALALTPSGGSGNYLYSWSSVDGNPANIVKGQKDQNDLTGGTYNVVITDADPAKSSCQTTLSATLTKAITMSNIDVQPVSCRGNDDGSISFDVNGGDGTYTYQWSTADGNATALTPGARNQKGLSPGTYTVTITDGRTAGGVNCAITRDFVIEASTGLNVNVAIVDIDCHGEEAGALTAVVTGGSGDYSFSWNEGAYTTNEISALSAGVYTLVVNDNILGCTYVGSYTIKEPLQEIRIDAVNITDVLCHGELTGEIDIQVSGGTAPYNYIWTGPGNPSGNNPSGLAAGTYSVTIQDAKGCTLPSGNIVIEQPASHVSVSNPQITDVSVTGGNNGQVQMDVTGGVAPYEFAWYDAADTQVSTTNPAAGLSSGTYRVVVTDDNNCSFEYTGIKVVEPGEHLGFEKTVHQVSPCNGADNGELHINRVYGGFPIAGSHYRIQVTGPGVAQDVNATSLHLTNLAAGNYRVIITDDVGTTVQEDIEITQYPGLTISTTVASQVDCYGTSTGVIEGTVSGGKVNDAGNYRVEIINEKGYFDSQNVAQTPGTFTFNNLPAGNYTITAYDYAGNFDTQSPTRGNCNALDQQVIIQPEAEVVFSSADGSSKICMGEDFNMVLTTSNWDFAVDGSLGVTLYDGTTYWVETVNKTPYPVTVTPSMSRTYRITKVVDPADANCLKGTGNGQVQLVVNPLPTANISGPSEVCEEGTVQLSVSLTGVAPWIVTWIDENNGTSDTDTVDISPMIITDMPVVDARYRVLSVADANTCSNGGDGVVEVTVNAKPGVTLTGSTDICKGGSATLDIEFTNTAYPYTISYEANGNPNTMVVSPSVGTTYNWMVSPRETTTYKITGVTDVNGCTMNMGSTISAVVTVNNLPGTINVINSTDDSDGVCQSQTGVVYTIDAVSDANGGYVWTAPAGSSIVSGNGTTSVVLDFDPDFAGGYLEVYATNACGNGDITQRWIPAKHLPDAVGPITASATEFCQGTAGITFSVSPVADATSYRWELPAGFIIRGTADAASIIVDLDPMLDRISADVKVTPINACGEGPNAAVLGVEVYPLPSANAGMDDHICGNSYILKATDPATINGNWSGRWEVIAGQATISDATAHNATLSNMSRGDVVLRWTVTNNVAGGLNNCSAADEVTIRNNTLSVSINPEANNVCDGTLRLSGTSLSNPSVTGGWVAVHPVGSSAVFSDATQANTTVTNLPAGLNRFRWTLMQNGCESFAEVEVINNEGSDAIINNGLSLDVCDSEVELSAVEPLVGKGRWSLVSGSGVIASPDQPVTQISKLQKGANQFKYTVENNGCSKSATITVYNNQLDVDAGDAFTQCGDTYTLKASEVPADASGQWSIPLGMGTGVFDDATSPEAIVSGLAKGDNTLEWSVTKRGCVSRDRVVITNNAATTATVGAHQELCAYETVLTGNRPAIDEGETAFWSVIKGAGTFDDVTAHDSRVSGLAHGENIFRWTINRGNCSSSADLIVLNKHVDVFAGKDTIICRKTVSLNATPPQEGDVGEWSLMSGVGGGTFKPEDINNPQILMGGLDYGKNGFVWTIDHDGCKSSDEVYVYNNNPYYVDANGDKREISAGDPIFITGTEVVMVADQPAVGSGVWSLVSGGGIIESPDKGGTRITDLRSGVSVFRWTVSNSICAYSSDVTITNGAIEQANAGRDNFTCDGTVKLAANEPITALGEWSVIEGAGKFEDKTKFNTMVIDLDKGENKFMWTLYNGSAQSKDIVVITNNEVAQAKAGQDKTICNTDEFELSAVAPEVGRGTVEWSVVSGSGVFDKADSPSTYVRGLSQGVNELKYRISLDKCYSEAYVSITNNTPTAPDAGDDLTICTDSVLLLPNTPAFGEGEWSVLSGHADPASLEKDWAKKLAPGENVLVWTINNNGCELTDSVSIINNEPAVAYAGEDILNGLCVDHTLLNASAPLSGRGIGSWERISGSGDVVDPYDPKSEVINLGVGVNRFRWTVDNGGCKSMDEVNIANNYLETDAGVDQILCADTATLKATSTFPGKGSWSVKAGAGTATFDDLNNPFTKVRNLELGDNVLIWTINYGGCSAVSEVVITNDKPTVAFAGDNQNLCEKNSTTLRGNHPSVGKGVWSVLNGSAVISNDTDPMSQISDLAFGDNYFRWTITNNECESVSDVRVSYNRIEANAGSDEPICEDYYQLSANTAHPGVGTWSVAGGSGQAIFEDINSPTTRVSNLAKGVNVLKWHIDYRGCETTSEVRITNNAPSESYAGNLQEGCEDHTLLDATVPSPGTGRWEVLMGSGTLQDETNAKTAVSGLSKGENVFRWVVSNGICESVDEVRVVNNAPSVPYAGADDESCYNDYQLKAEQPLHGQGLWTIEQGGGNFTDPTSPTASIRNMSPGVNIFKWTLTKGQCDLSHSVTITNNAADQAQAGPDITDCKDWAELDANIPKDGLGEGQWSLVSGKGDFDNAADPKSVIRNLGFGENILMWSIIKGNCFTSDQLIVFNKVPDQAEAGDNRATCEDYIVLNANDPVDGSGTWSVVSGKGVFEDEHKHNTMVTGMGLGENVYKWTIAYGDCTTEDMVTISSAKATAYAGEDDVTYEPEYLLQAANAGSQDALWTVIAGSGTFDDATFFNTTVRDLAPGKNTFRWSITTGDCEVYDEVTIDYKEVPDAGFIVDKEEGCFPHKVKFTNYSVGGDDFTWDFGDGVSSTVRSPSHTYEQAGIYTAALTVAGPDGQDAVFTQRIIVHDHPVADFTVGPEVVYIPEDEIRCHDMSIDAIRWFWDFGDGNSSEERNPSHTYSDGGVYDITLRVENALGCESSLTKEEAVTAELSGFVAFPTAFRPRPGGSGNTGNLGDRSDAIFKPQHRDVATFHIQVFNRWGQMIFESHNIDEGWNGNFKGKLAPQAVYVYKAAGTFTNGREFNKAGSILLVR